jgi:gliding motility-associated-like protein
MFFMNSKQFFLVLFILNELSRMKNFYRSLLLLLICVCQVSLVQAQLSTVGKEFWVGFMDNNRIIPNAYDQAVIVISANEDATGVIEYLGNTVNFSINQGQQFTHIVSSQSLDLLHRNSGVISDKGIYILSDGKISVYAFNERFRSADGTVVLPVGALGKDYLITSHYETLTAPVSYNGNVNDESQLLIVATEDNTRIEITTSVNSISGNQADVPSTITLNRGQSYQIKAKEDLTGSRVRVVGDNANECKRIAVFGGNKWTSVGNCGAANDNLFQQAYPVNTWGTQFVHVALSGRTSGELVKVLAAENGTIVTVGGVNRGTIDAGEFLTLDFAINETAKINTSKPASVTVFAKSQECNQINAPNYQNGDPFMITYSPVEQLLKEIRFNALSLVSIVSHYVNIVVKAGSENLTILDGVNQGTLFFPVPGDPNFSYARVSISQGVHQLSNREGFTAYVYGFGFLESYGFAVGAALDNLNFETAAEYEFDVAGENIACLNQEGSWTINPDNPDFTYFVWDFGDGTDAVIGKDVTHIYTKPGDYEVIVLAALSPDTCDQQEEVTFDVTVLEITAEFIGQISVCPDVEEMVYKLKDLVNVDSVAFTVEGGLIIENYGDSILVNWGPANPNAKVIAKPFSVNGCPGEEITLNVVINQRIEAPLPLGEVQICFDPSVSHFYEAPNYSSGRGYAWEITGGRIVAGANQGRVEVIWDQPGVSASISYRTFSLVDELCEGVSEGLSVKVADVFELNLATLNQVKCFGEATGEIELNIIGGVAPFKIVWSHNPTLNSPKASNLKAGTYSVTVTDQLGCILSLNNMEVVEPALLEVLSIIPVATSCFGKADGEVDIKVIGGTPPFSLEYQGTNTFAADLKLDGLAKGSYAWEVVDAVGCRLPISFEIDSPMALLVDVRLVKPACPGESNGELVVLSGGGVGPYLYQWEFGAAKENQLLGLAKGEYGVAVTDNFGCVSLGSGLVTEAAPEVRMPTGYYPDRDRNSYLAVSNCELNFQIWIYNRWGQLIYTGAEGWDGMISDSQAPSGTYSYQIQYSFYLEDELKIENKTGAFTLIK